MNEDSFDSLSQYVDRCVYDVFMEKYPQLVAIVREGLDMGWTPEQIRCHAARTQSDLFASAMFHLAEYLLTGNMANPR
jgi:hypothetical protein